MHPGAMWCTMQIHVVACVGILIYINTGSRARDASSGVGGDLQRIKLDDSMDTSNSCLRGMFRSTPHRSRSNDFACTKNISSRYVRGLKVKFLAERVVIIRRLL